jgi:hypothetical protein
MRLAVPWPSCRRRLAVPWLSCRHRFANAVSVAVLPCAGHLAVRSRHGREQQENP